MEEGRAVARHPGRVEWQIDHTLEPLREERWVVHDTCGQLVLALCTQPLCHAKALAGWLVPSSLARHAKLNPSNKIEKVGWWCRNLTILLEGLSFA